jgi:plastocyanin
MPPWSVDQNGPLNDFQIEQIVTLITSKFSLEAWEFAVEESNHTDEFDVPKHLLAAIDEGDETLQLNDVQAIAVPEDAGSAPFLIRIGGDTLKDPYELMAVVSVDTDANTIEVERGVENTTALAHEADATVYEGPILPGTTITGADPNTDAPCGQARASTSDGGGEAVELADGDTIDVQDNVFVFDGNDNPAFTAPAGITISLASSGQNLHNLRIGEDLVSDDIAGGETVEFELDLEPGTYDYVCDFHTTQMLGTFEIIE